uniref:protein disulfide-isomerase n=1 Tax=Chlamydomonas leiostraca TaxID=1034604 RepID=A0A7S0R2Q6_9CHLO|eukprot:CAMPEP_0202866638 /NCGR_PEP_ID=MMETSP1391-20130828/8231_1 /ASSEMBLY_ACC=CAM_ASM_000867 /TAXON_ID=1034604 /ORGANISM="Chlamydomonas leiostraca, Strain SAG 11-49" /LENGTH=450 /DNA_ID=CAMNT_0049546607 /DNA_START=75 /DNA_END=1427 /DNA_ORIENTATION=+
MAARCALLALAVVLVASYANALPYSASSPVTNLDSSNFRSTLKKAGFAVVEFYAPWCGHCKNLAPEWEKAAKAMKGTVTVAAVDADAHKDLGSEFGIQGFPTIKFLWMEGDKVKSADYNGGRTAKDIIAATFDKAKAYALKKIGEKGASSGGSKKAGGSGGNGGGDGGFYSGTDVVTLTDANFQEEVAASGDLWFVEFYAPWCGHCKNLKPSWIEAATELKGKVKVGAVDCTAHQSTCQEFGVRGYPTIKFFGKNKASPEDFNGGRDASSIVNFGNQRWSKLAPPPEVRELVDESVWEKECTGEDGAGARQLCFVAFLPDILDSQAAGRNRYIKTLKELANKYKDRPFSYLWAQGGSQAALEANFGVGGAGYPALVAYKPKDHKYSVSKAAFESAHVVEFVESIRKGGEPVLAIQGSPAKVATHAPWDGKDAAVQLEDEFSLDDLMNEEL